MHEKNFLHNDIKPQNMAFGKSKELGNSTQIVYLIDFGISAPYRDLDSLEHVPLKDNAPCIGTRLFMPASTHMRKTLSRRDDLESLGYTLVYLLNGTLPWKENLSSFGKEVLYRMKKNTPAELLCEGMPLQLSEYIKYVRKLGFTECPDYEWLQNLFLQALEELNKSNV